MLGWRESRCCLNLVKRDPFGCASCRFTRSCRSGFVVEKEFLLAGDGVAIASGGLEDPGLNDGENRVVHRLAEALGDFGLGDFAGFIDHDIDDNVSASVARKLGEVRRRAREEGGKGDRDVAASERVGSLRGVGLGRAGSGADWRGWRRPGLRGEQRDDCGVGGLRGLRCCRDGLWSGAAGRVGETDAGAVLVAGELAGSDPGFAMDEDGGEEHGVQQNGGGEAADGARGRVGGGREHG
jgi:hypothetical protein